jgi:hypothetical protein
MVIADSREASESTVRWKAHVRDESKVGKAASREVHQRQTDDKRERGRKVANGVKSKRRMERTKEKWEIRKRNGKGWMCMRRRESG